MAQHGFNTYSRRLIQAAVAATLALSAADAAAQMQPIQIFYEFHPIERPLSGVIEATDDALYGTANGGDGSYDGSKLYRMTKQGELSIVHDFEDPVDGAGIGAELLLGSDGLLYGVTSFGGTFDNGVVFRVATNGRNFEVLHHFTGAGGRNPHGGLIEVENGIFYGVTSAGGLYDYGTVYSLTSSGTLTTLYHFSNTEGYNPRGPLIPDGNGALLGVTANSPPPADGSLFRLETDGSLRTLHSFVVGEALGYNPIGGLLRASDGNVYGVNATGASGSRGSIYRLDSNDDVGLLASITDTDSYPSDGLVQAPNGKLYGSTDGYTSQYYSYGHLFEVGLDGSYRIVHNYNVVSGASPMGRLMVGADGHLYGTTSEFGWGPTPTLIGGQGTVFRYVIR